MLFVKTQVVEHVLHKSSCFTTEKKQRLENKLEGLKKQGKKKKQDTRTIAKAKARGIVGALNSKDNKLKSKL